jgi:ribosomal protein S30
LLVETVLHESAGADRAASNILIASKQKFNFEARVSNRVEYGKRVR